MLSLENIINTSISALLTATGWIIKKLHYDFVKLRNDFHSLQVKMPEKYLMKSDFKEFKTELFSRLDRIEGKIEKNM